MGERNNKRGEKLITITNKEIWMENQFALFPREAKIAFLQQQESSLKTSQTAHFNITPSFIMSLMHLNEWPSSEIISLKNWFKLPKDHSTANSSDAPAYEKNSLQFAFSKSKVPNYSSVREKNWQSQPSQVTQNISWMTGLMKMSPFSVLHSCSPARATDIGHSFPTGIPPTPPPPLFYIKQCM